MLKLFSALATATQTTLQLALFAVSIGLPLAIVFACAIRSHCSFLRHTIHGTTLLLRALPELLVVLLVYMGSTQLLLRLPQTAPLLSPFGCGVVALALIFSAYASEILRGALQAIPSGQYEAGLALGMQQQTVFFRLLLPQAWYYALPALGNQWLVLLKDTALVSLIGVNDVMQQSKLFAIFSGKPFTHYLAAAVIYFMMSFASQWFLHYWISSDPAAEQLPI